MLKWVAQVCPIRWLSPGSEASLWVICRALCVTAYLVHVAFHTSPRYCPQIPVISFNSSPVGWYPVPIGVRLQWICDLLHQIAILQNVKIFLLSFPIVCTYHNKIFACTASYFQWLMPVNHLLYKGFQIFSKFIYTSCFHFTPTYVRVFSTNIIGIAIKSQFSRTKNISSIDQKLLNVTGLNDQPTSSIEQ